MAPDALTPDQTILLDSESISIDELSMPALKHEINLRKRPNWLLVKMMNALEKKRQRKGLGWSRAWNKYGLNVYRTHICDVQEDSEYLDPIAPFLESYLSRPPAPYAEFIKDLFSDPMRMAFTFYHNHDDGESQYEGLTLSLGRKVVEDRTKRDRIDIILQDKRVNGAVDGQVDRVRVYICPWVTYSDKEHHCVDSSEFSKDEHRLVQDLYDHAVRYYHRWKGEEERQWSHWSVRYIDYFGPRSFIAQGSSFT